MDSSLVNEPRNKEPIIVDDDNKVDILIKTENQCNTSCVYTGSCFEILPREVLLDILTRLPISSLIQFRFVCWSCNTLSHDPELPWLYNALVARSDPVLVFYCAYLIRNQLSFVEYDGDHAGDKIVRKISSAFYEYVPEFKVVGSCNGLLCLSDSIFDEQVFVFNPFTRKHLELPKCKQFQDKQEVLFGFGFLSITNEYKVVRIAYYPTPHRLIGNHKTYTRSEVHVLTIGEPNGWRCLGKVPYQLNRQDKEVVVLNGRLHWVGNPGRLNGLPGRNIVSFDLEDEEFKLVSNPVSESNYHLLVIDGCLAAAVQCAYMKLEIWVMKEYNVKESWMKCIHIHGEYMARVRSHDYGISRKWNRGKMVRVLCVLKNGEMLLEDRGGSLVQYDPIFKEFKDVVFHGMPKLFQTIVHVGSLNWTDTPI